MASRFNKVEEGEKKEGKRELKKKRKKAECLYLWLFARPSLSEQMPGIIPTPRPAIKVQ